MKIKVVGQVNPKFINGDAVYSTNRWIDCSKKGWKLKVGDDVLIDGAWYVIESIL